MKNVFIGWTKEELKEQDQFVKSVRATKGRLFMLGTDYLQRDRIEVTDGLRQKESNKIMKENSKA